MGGDWFDFSEVERIEPAPPGPQATTLISKLLHRKLVDYLLLLPYLYLFFRVISAPFF